MTPEVLNKESNREKFKQVTQWWAICSAFLADFYRTPGSGQPAPPLCQPFLPPSLPSFPPSPASFLPHTLSNRFSCSRLITFYIYAWKPLPYFVMTFSMSVFNPKDRLLKICFCISSISILSKSTHTPTPGIPGTPGTPGWYLKANGKRGFFSSHLVTN